MKNLNLRPAAVPLVTVDPYFSIWSFSDELNEDTTYHWTGKRNPMCAYVNIDGKNYLLMGQMAYDRNRRTPSFVPKIKQKMLKVSPTKTTYYFENEFADIKLEFLSPLILSRLDIMSCPVSYIEYDIRFTDGKDHECFFCFDISSECAVDDYDSEVIFKKHKYSVAFGNAVQKPLANSGDSVGINWGYIHVVHPGAAVLNGKKRRDKAPEQYKTNVKYKPFSDFPCAGFKSTDTHGMFVLAYDDIKSIVYFGKETKGYYTRYYSSFEAMLEYAINNYGEIKKLCGDFDDRLISEARKIDPKYALIVSLAYRQAVAAHKLIEDDDGNIVFLSKECHSNGCAGTLDVTYPSAPLFLKYNPELVLGMLRPIIKYARSSAWNFDFAPHDVGQYPIANGQVYAGNGEEKRDSIEEFQMPVEECGNMLICVAAVSESLNSKAFAYENKDLLKKWADYLVNVGYDPDNQLCTDDFAGHFAHNCNLGIKSIMGIASYGRIFEDRFYTEKAREYAKCWEAEASNGNFTRLTFDRGDSWGLKYNIVWDKLLKFNLFSEKIFENEVRLYTEKMNRYGVPLDSRMDYTKLDWLVWTTVMTENDAYKKMVFDAVFRFINETPDRVPMTDWFYTSVPRMHGFQNRSVVGGLFINMLDTVRTSMRG